MDESEVRFYERAGVKVRITSYAQVGMSSSGVISLVSPSTSIPSPFSCLFLSLSNLSRSLSCVRTVFKFFVRLFTFFV